MKKRVSASTIMRVVSIFGILFLLALQYVWWRNAYRAVEMDVMSKAQECLRKATDKALMYQLDSTSKGIRIINEYAGEKKPKNLKIYSTQRMSSTFEVEYSIDECLNIIKNPVTDILIDNRFCTFLNLEFGLVPKHTLKICRDTIQISPKDNLLYNRIAFGSKQDSIFHQFGYNAYAVVVMQSPIKFYLKKGSFIFIISIILVLLVGSILILQYISMQRDRKFADFIIEYTQMIAHDLRTPVTGLQMLFKMFQQNKFSTPEMKVKYNKEGVNLTKKILLNLDNILYMAKSEQMELPVFLQELEIRDFMERIVDGYRERNYFPKVIRMVTTYEPQNFKCRLDVGLMENAVSNLLENAIKYTHEDTFIEVHCSKVGNIVEIKVKDNGMGMSDVDQKRVFELFERGSANRNQQFPGFGIGLHFVERAVKAHGGKVSVKSELDKGAEFTIRYTSLEFS